MVKNIVGWAEDLTPTALVGAGGIGKTSVALTILHDDRIKRRFGVNRRFIRCDKFPASLANFLRQLSKAIGAGIENPEDLTPVRPFLSSKDMLVVLDNAESVLDPHVTSAEEIYDAVEELSRLGNICLCITSRISTFPPSFKLLDIPTLSKEAACATFHRIYTHGENSDLTNILEQLDFHPLSITILATVAHHNGWNTNRLAKEWDERRTDVLLTDHNKSLAATIGLSLSSLMFQGLGPDARDLLGVVAFYPQGVDENNIDWLFPTIAGRRNIFDKFCVLSLAYRCDGFITMLAPIRDHLSPKDPASAPLLCSTKERYFTRLSAHVEPGKPGFEEARWITSEDVNVEHLLDVFTTTDVASDGVWNVCRNFMTHLLWHKARLVTLGKKIEALADDHPSKPECILSLSLLFQKVGNDAECKRLLTHASNLSRGQGNDRQLARILGELSTVHLRMGFTEEGIHQAKEASGIFKRLGTEDELGGTVDLAKYSISLTQSYLNDNKLDAAEEAMSLTIQFLAGTEERFLISKCYYLLGVVYQSKDEAEKAVYHLKVALEIAAPFNWFSSLVWIRFALAPLLFDQGKFDEADAQIAQAKLDAINGNEAYLLAHAMEMQALAWHEQRRLEEARSEALCAVDAFEKLGAAKDVENVMELLRKIDHNSRENVTPNKLNVLAYGVLALVAYLFMFVWRP